MAPRDSDQEQDSPEATGAAVSPNAEANVAELRKLVDLDSGRDTERSIYYRHELSRALLWARHFPEAAKSFLATLRLHNYSYLANVTLLNDFGVSLVLLDDPAGYPLAYYTFLLSSIIRPTDVIVGNLKGIAGLLREAEKRFRSSDAARSPVGRQPLRHEATLVAVLVEEQLLPVAPALGEDLRRWRRP
jgi:hypothetical protein